MRGRKPAPTKILELRGSWRAKTRPKEPKPAAGVPTAPAFLKGAAKREWARIIRVYKACNVLTRLDRAELASYCSSYALWIWAEEEIRKHGPTFTTPNGYQQQTPAVGICNRAKAEMRKSAGELGLTPASRPRLQVETAGPGDSLDQYLKERRA